MTSAKRGTEKHSRAKKNGCHCSIRRVFSHSLLALFSAGSYLLLFCFSCVCVFFALFLPTALGVATFISPDSSKHKLAKDVSS